MYVQVKQLSAIDGRVLLDFEIAPTGSTQNYTRSYYMNGRDYIISGSCDENIVRICCAQTGRRLRDVSLEVLNFGLFTFTFSLFYFFVWGWGSGWTLGMRHWVVTSGMGSRCNEHST